MGTLVRQIMEDTVLDGPSLSRTDGMIKMLNPVVHNDILNWGLDIDNTNARRFGILNIFPSLTGLENGLAKVLNP